MMIVPIIIKNVAWNIGARVTKQGKVLFSFIKEKNNKGRDALLDYITVRRKVFKFDQFVQWKRIGSTRNLALQISRVAAAAGVAAPRLKRMSADAASWATFPRQRADFCTLQMRMASVQRAAAVKWKDLVDSYREDSPFALPEAEVGEVGQIRWKVSSLAL